MTRTLPPESATREPRYPPVDPTGTVWGAPVAEKDSFNLSTVFRAIRRRQRPFLLTLAGVTLLLMARTLYTLYFHPVYQGGFTLLISDPVNERPSGAQGGAGSAVDGGGAIESLARNTFAVDVPTLIRVLESESVLGPVYADLLRGGMKQNQLPEIRVSLAPGDPARKNDVASGVVNVTAKGSDRQVVDRGLQLAAKAYLNWSTEQRQERVREGLRFLDRQAPVLQSKSDELQQRLERFRQSHNLVEPSAEAGALRQQLESLQQQLRRQGAEQERLRQVQADVAAGKLSARAFAIGGSSGAEAAASGAGGENLEANLPNQALLDELQRLEQEIAAARSRYTADSPVMQSLLAAREQLRPQLQRKGLEAVGAALRQNERAMATTRDQIDRLEQQFQRQPELLREYDALRQKLAIADGNLENYLRTREQFQLEIAQRSTPWKLISPVNVPETPVEPRLDRGLLQGLLLGVVAGTGVALLRERLDHVFHTPQEVREELGVPLLGHLPYVAFFDGVRRERRFLLGELDRQEEGRGGYQRFYYQEALRNLYTSLRFLHSERPLRTAAITSSVASEGKSLLTILLAKTLAELGQRVLLVDADLRKPQIHHRLGLDNLRGLSHLLTEEGSDWRSVVQAVPQYEGWSVITAGTVAPDPPRLLGSARMAEIVREMTASGAFDLILYDTPPALGLADAPLVAEHLEGIVLLVSLNRVDRALPPRTAERIRSSGVPLLGVVTNNCKPRNEKEASADYSPGYDVYRGYERSGELDAETAYSYYQATRPGRDGTGGGQRRTLGQRLEELRQKVNRWLDDA